jgi:hypothetical protein
MSPAPPLPPARHTILLLLSQGHVYSWKGAAQGCKAGRPRIFLRPQNSGQHKHTGASMGVVSAVLQRLRNHEDGDSSMQAEHNFEKVGNR